MVSLYTSRVVLKVLGAEDLGIYNVVGGIVAMMSFFQTAQTKATSRFITYELGKGGNSFSKVFSVYYSILFTEVNYNGYQKENRKCGKG